MKRGQGSSVRFERFVLLARFAWAYRIDREDERAGKGGRTALAIAQSAT
jgi:hypothetical protein